MTVQNQPSRSETALAAGKLFTEAGTLRIPMSYGNIDLDTFIRHTWEMARNISPNNLWEKLAVRWPNMTTDSVVVEVGGYHGQWAYRMAENFNPRIFIFEPQSWCCEIIKGVMKGKNFKLFPFALGVQNGKFPVFEYETDGCTFEEKEDRGWGHATLPMRNIKQVFNKEGLFHIDVLHMNAEGWEFVLIPYMFKNGILPDVLMFQGHDKEREEGLRELIKKYYVSVWDYGTTLSAWRRIDA